MRYIRRQTTNTQSSGIGRGVHVKPIDKEVVLDSKNSVLVPKGTTANRPQFPKNGHMRYNTDDNRFEVYENGSWAGVRGVTPVLVGITQQGLGNGDATETVFGPLASGDPEFPVPVAAENVLVFVENVFQISTTNYTLEQSVSSSLTGPNAPYADGWYIKFSSAPDLGKPITVLHNFDK